MCRGRRGGRGVNERGSSQPLGTRSIWSIIICILFYSFVLVDIMINKECNICRLIRTFIKLVY